MSTRFAFPANSHGPALVRLLLVSFLFSVVSFASNLHRYIGSSSLFMIPAAWFLTLVHHLVFYSVLPRRKGDAHDPENMPRCVKHAANIWSLHYLALLWLAGAITTLVITTTVVEVSDHMGHSACISFISGVLAVVESFLLMAMSILSWKALSNEGYLGEAFDFKDKDLPNVTNVVV
ncbi:hypothetical protein FS749_000716 [Ceratobasidium sp. UAMH 11750]|nr:hypothetical protein FS749_000716 [Ceratobasidium sp. UAMH 11750]